MESISEIVKQLIENLCSALGLFLSFVGLITVIKNGSAVYYNFIHFRKGGLRITYQSGAYTIHEGRTGKTIYKSSDNKKDFVQYRDMNRLEKPERIPNFLHWNKFKWADDIRQPQYPIRLLFKQKDLNKR